MKKLIYPLTILCFSCSNKPTEKVKVQETKIESKLNAKNSVEKNDICWIGTLDSKIPIFIHFQIVENLIFGEIVYLNTKDKKPIRIIGTIEEDRSYRILEFESNGNISGILTGLPKGNLFIGRWFSPKTRKELTLNLALSDSTIKTISIETRQENIFGDYYYQYSEAGYQGEFSITKIDNKKAAFRIFCVTEEHSRNIAEIRKDSIELSGSKFTYKVPATDSCEFEVRFFKEFLFINYTRGYCSGQFGINATIDGIFLKSK